ncbi:MAG: cupin domain-containing protein [Chloroflexota bacterium]
MKRFRIISVMAALLTPLWLLGSSGTLAAPNANAAATAAAAGPTISFQGEFPLTVEAGEYSLTYLVLDFAPGAEIPLHYHGGPALVVGMEGMLTLRPEAGGEHTLMPGDVVNEKAGVRHVMINTTNANARIMAVVLLPKGAQLTNVVDTGATNPNPAPGPTVPFQGAYPLTVAAGDYSLVNLVLDFAPGAEIPLHYHGGPVVIVGKDGTLTLRSEAGAVHTVGSGDVMNEQALAKHVMTNNSNTDATVLAGVLLPKGAELTTIVASQPAGMPSTGAGDNTGIIVRLASLTLTLLVLGSLILFVGRKARAANRATDR